MKYIYDPTSPRVKEAKHVMFIISKALNITVNKLKGNSRFRHLVDARRICYVILKDQMNLTLGEIGSYFDRDHATVLHNYNQHEILYKTDFEYRINYDKAIKRVENNEYVENDMYELLNNMIIRLDTLEKQIKKLNV